MKPSLKAGLTHRFSYRVPETKTVPHVYEEAPQLRAMPEVFATGFMVGLMEWTCVQLLEPHLVKEERSTDGKVLYRAETRAVRRVMSGEVARTVQQLLLAVVREGTATKADLATFEVAGKSGTARRTSQNAGYVAGNYTASFVGLFPGERSAICRPGQARQSAGRTLRGR